MPHNALRAIALAALLVLCRSALAWSAPGDAPPQTVSHPADAERQPFLRIETGVHEAAINRMVRLADGTVITASDDKTARVWSADLAEAREMILPPIGPDDTGALFAVAASAKALAIGGRIRDATGHFAVVLYRQSPIRAVGMLAPLPSAVTALAFSPNGEALAIGLQSGGVWVVGLGGDHAMFQDGHYDRSVSWLAWDPRGRLMAVAEDSKLRIYDPGLAKSTDVSLPPGAHPYSVAASPDGKHIAVGDRQRPVVHLLDADRLRLERELEGAPKRLGSLNVVAFSPDGHTLFAGGSYVDETGALFVRRWQMPAGTATDLPVARDLITDLLPLDDALLFTSAEPSVGRIAADGHVVARLRSRHIDFRNAGRAGFLLSEDGARVRLPVDPTAGAAAVMPSARAVVADMRTRTIAPADQDTTGQDNKGMSPPFAAAGGLGITEWQNSRTPRLNGQAIKLEPRETVRAVAVQQSGAGAAVGTDFFVRFLTRQGEQWSQPTEAPAWAVNVSADGHWVVAGLGDGSVHWYRARDGQPGLTLFVDPPTGHFVIWTPEGFFDHDHPDSGPTDLSQADGRSLIGYRFNARGGRESRFIATGQLYPRFFRPDLVGLALRDDPAAHRRLADEVALVGNIQLALSEGLPPQIELLEACTLGLDAPADGCSGQTPVSLDRPGTASSGMLRIRYALRDPTGHVGAVVVSRNDAVVHADTVIESTDEKSRTEQATLPLGRGKTVVSLTPVSATGAVEAANDRAAKITLVPAVATRSSSRGPTQTGSAPPAERPPSHLYVLSVGADKTGNPDLKVLDNAVNDARAIARLMASPAPGVYAGRPDITTLVDDESTAGAILNALRRIAKLATPDDVVMIYFAGHGRTVDGRYYFAPRDLGSHDAVALGRVHAAVADQSIPDSEYNAAVDVLFRTEGLSQEQILAVVQTIQASRIAIVLDTCFSATMADEDAILRRDENRTVTDRIGHASGRFILSGSFEAAFDGSGGDGSTASDGHGLFTSVLIQALQGRAGRDEDGRVSVFKIATYTKQHVVEESLRRLDHVQEPAYFFAGNDFFALR